MRAFGLEESGDYAAAEKAGRRAVEGFVPGDARELAGALGASTAQGMQQPVGMVNTLGIAADLGAHDAQRIAVVLGTPNPADAVVIEQLDLEGTGRGTVVRANRVADGDFRVHAGVRFAAANRSGAA